MSDPTGHDKPSTSYTAMPANTGGVRIGAITYNELTASLIWPKLFRAFGMSLAPTRLVLGIVAATMLILLMTAVDYAWFLVTQESDVATSASPYLGMLKRTWGEGYTRYADHWGMIMSMQQGTLGGVIPGLSVAGLLGAMLLLPIVVFFGGMISSMVAVDVSANLSQGIGEAEKHTRRRFMTLLRGALLPLIILLALQLLLLGLAALGFSLEFTRFIGAVLWPIGFAVALVQVVLLILTVLGGPLILPAVVVEETDSIDAIQRAYAYVTSRFWRFAGYALVLFVIWTVASAVVSFVIGNAGYQVTSMISASIGDGDTGVRTESLLEWWGRATQALVWGWSFSFFFTASTILYLLMRQVCDAQDISEIVLEGDRTPSRFVEKSAGVTAEGGSADASLEL